MLVIGEAQTSQEVLDGKTPIDMFELSFILQEFCGIEKYGSPIESYGLLRAVLLIFEERYETISLDATWEQWHNLFYDCPAALWSYIYWLKERGLITYDSVEHELSLTYRGHRLKQALQRHVPAIDVLYVDPVAGRVA